MAKHKIINDPVHGFISVEGDILLALIDHPWFQRLRRIRQLGMTSLVYPGAQHTRFQHAIGAMHLMQSAVDTLRNRGVKLRDDERMALQIAILLHDIGHGPFSHALEHCLIDVDHEQITQLIMDSYEHTYGGVVSDAIRVFRGECRPFMHELISSKLDTDRLDYLKRDSFFTGVVEGTIGSERIIKMLSLTPKEHLAVEEKGIYTIEDFLLTRRLMYWQVYLHKTVVAAENMLRSAIRRARYLRQTGKDLWMTPTLSYFLDRDINFDTLGKSEEALSKFCMLDDDDITTSLKAWMNSNDRLLSMLSSGLVGRKIFSIELSRQEYGAEQIDEVAQEVAQEYGLTATETAEYLVVTGSLSSKTYSQSDGRVNILMRDGKVCDLADVSTLIGQKKAADDDKMYFLCRPRRKENTL